MNTQDIILKHIPNAGENLVKQISQIISDCRLKDNTEVNKSEVIDTLHKLWRRDVVTLKQPLDQWIKKAFQAGLTAGKPITIENVRISIDFPNVTLFNLNNDEKLFLSKTEQRGILHQLNR